MKTEVLSVAVAFAIVCGARATSISYTAAVSDGCDYTNGIVTVTVASVSDAPSGALLRLVSTSPSGVQQTIDKTFAGTGPYEFNVPSLSPGLRYAYSVSLVTSGGAEIQGVSKLSGTILAASAEDWFSADAATDTPVGGAWTAQHKPEIVNSKYNLTNGTEYIFSATAPKSASARVMSEVQFRGGFDEYELADELEALASANPQGGITLECDGEGNLAWRGLSRDNDGLVWLSLGGVAASTSVVYRIVIDADYSSATPYVSYLVAAGAGDFVRLEDESGNVWFPGPTSSGTALSGLKYVGAGSLSSLSGSYADSSLATVGGTGYASFSSALGAATSGNPAVLKTNVSWVPAQGAYYVNANGKNISYSAPEGWYVSLSGGMLRAIDHAVAAIGNTGYGFLDLAFADAAAGNTVSLLTNVVCDVALETPAVALTLDLAGCFLNMAAAMTIPDGGSVDVTNSTAVAGGFGGTAVSGAGTFTVSGGAWENNSTYSANLRSGLAFVAGAPVTADGVTYNYTVTAASSVPEGGAVAVPMAGGSGSPVATAVVADTWIADNVDGADLSTAEGRAAVATALNQAGLNGFTKLESYVLGLDPKNASSKPVVASSGNGSVGAGTIRLSVADSVSVNSASGVPVSFSVSTSTTPDFSSATTSGANRTGVFDIALDPAGSKLMYYRVNVAFGE